MTDTCPERIIRAASPEKGKSSPNTISLLPSPDTANLKRIVCNVLEPVLLRLLVCKDENITKTPDDCPYPEHKNREATKWICNSSENKLAQIYIRHEKIAAKARSCLIIFVEGRYLGRTDELLETLLCTVSLLNIEQEKPYFYIFYYGQPVIQLTAANTCKLINNKIKEKIKIYSFDEDICIALPIRRTSESLIINHSKKFSCSAA